MASLVMTWKSEDQAGPEVTMQIIRRRMPDSHTPIRGPRRRGPWSSSSTANKCLHHKRYALVVPAPEKARTTHKRNSRKLNFRFKAFSEVRSLHSPGPILSGVLMYRTGEFFVVHKKHNTTRNMTIPSAGLAYRGGAMRYSSSSRPLLLSQSSYFWPSGMVAPSRDQACSSSCSLVTPMALLRSAPETVSEPTEDDGPAPGYNLVETPDGGLSAEIPSSWGVETGENSEKEGTGPGT